MSAEVPTDPRIAAIPLWYHTLELAPGIETPGYFDLRPIVDKLPWPDVRGKRCLDIGTWDGFLAFELERRGAREVVAVDLPDPADWDFPIRLKTRGAEFMKWAVGPKKGEGFRVARDALDSNAILREISVYDLRPEEVGTFDVVVCGSLLLHLRDPLRALEAIASVCKSEGYFLSTNQVDMIRSVVRRTQPLFRLDGLSDLSHWFLPNVAGHRRMIEAGGFEIERESGLYAIPFGKAHPEPDSGGGFSRARPLVKRAMRTVVAGNHGVPHHAVLARPMRRMD